MFYKSKVNCKAVYDVIISTVMSNLNHFVISRTKADSTTETIAAVDDRWGKIEQCADGTEVNIIYELFTRLLNDNGFTDIRSILRDMRQEKYLNCEADRLYRKRKIENTDTVACKMVVLYVK